MDQAIKSSTSSVSIVILTMNRSSHMRIVLENISLQSLVPEEIIIIDNHSKEIEQQKNRELADKYKADYYLMNEKERAIITNRAYEKFSKLDLKDYIHF